MASAEFAAMSAVSTVILIYWPPFELLPLNSSLLGCLDIAGGRHQLIGAAAGQANIERLMGDAKGHRCGAEILAVRLDVEIGRDDLETRRPLKVNPAGADMAAQGDPAA